MAVQWLVPVPERYLKYLTEPHCSATLTAPEEIERAILRTVTDVDFRQFLIHKGLTRAKEFTWDRCAAETLQVLKEVAAK